MDAAKAEGCGWITLDPGLVPGEPGKCSGWPVAGNSALWLPVQVHTGRAERLPGGPCLAWVGAGELMGGQSSLEEVTKPWRLVGNRAESLTSQCTSSKFATTSWY